MRKAHMKARQKRISKAVCRGVSLIEVLVVLAILAIMLGMLLPAIHYARETSRRAQCQSNLHELGVAVTNDFVARHKLPDAPTSGTMSGWAIEILPFLEDSALAVGLAGSPPLNSPAALVWAKNRPAIMSCPSAYDGDSDVAGIPISDYAGSFARGIKGSHWSIRDIPVESRVAWVTSPEWGHFVVPTVPSYPHNGSYNIVQTDGDGNFASVHFGSTY
jgi:prepilin-type N-terminal cleavage/methylation domain-containing protein